jgi:predicted S18 family serine protease
MTADQDAVDQILDLLYRLKDEFALAQSYDADAEAEAQAAHDAYVIEMNDTIADRKAHLADLEDREANLVDEIAAAEQALADAEAKLALYIQLIADETAACEEKRQTYFRETDERNEELDVVA